MLQLNFVIGSCGVAGCTDADACNYSADATFDDGSCDVPAEGLDCEGNCSSGELLSYGRFIRRRMEWCSIDNQWYSCIVYGSSASACVDLLDCNTIYGLPGSHDGRNIMDIREIFDKVVSGGSGAGDYVETHAVLDALGCTDEAAKQL